MAKRRGLSSDEKRVRLLDLFFEKKDFYQLKELEKIAQKEKGITSMTVKEILQSLVDDGLVDTDRIGTSNYFWAFPSKASNKRKKKVDELQSEVHKLDEKLSVLEKELELAQMGREKSEERMQLLKALEEKKAMKNALGNELEQYKACDPETLKELRQQTQVAVAAANRWTENVFVVRSWCKDRFSVDHETLDKQFGIPEDFDYF